MLIIFIFFFFFSVSSVRADFNYHYLIEDNSIVYKIGDLNENKDLIQDLLLIEEKDHSLTVLFSIISEDQEAKTYYLNCLERGLEVELSHNNNFFTDIFYQYLNPNINQELIFNIEEFSCPGNVVIYSKNLSGEKSVLSDQVTIINYQDLNY